MFNVKIYNQISAKGLDQFPRASYGLSNDIDRPDALLLRSHQLHQESIPETVKAVARAGAGTNNIPVADYTQRGIVVFNTPGANANAVKELVLAGLLLSTRRIIDGVSYVQGLTDIADAKQMNKQLEAEKKRFVGTELHGKSIGIVGLGAIGSMVADMALALGMNVIGYDPALSVEAAWRLSSRVKRMENLQALLAGSDYISLHIPAIAATQHLINADMLKAVRPGAVLLNFARSAIVDAQAVVDSLDAAHLGRYVCDFPEPCLLSHAKVMAMPHIGASTIEAEENCAVMAAKQLMDYLENGNIGHSVNFPTIFMDRAAAGSCRLTFANHNVAGVLGDVLSVFNQHKVNVIDMVNKSRDQIAYNIVDLERAPSAEAIAAIRNIESVVGLRLLNAPSVTGVSDK